MPFRSIANNTEGCEFIFSIPPAYEEQQHGNFITIYTIALEDCEISVEVPSLYLNKKKAKKYENLVFQIDASFGQAAEWNSELKYTAPTLSNIYKNSAITVSSDKPILCYVLCQYYWTSDGFTAFPTSALSNDYVVSSYSDMGGLYGHYYPSEVTISGVMDNTKIDFIIGGNPATQINYRDSLYFSGDTIEIELDKNDVCLLMSSGILRDHPDLSGSRIKSNNPVSVTSGNVCANIPVKNPTCDYIVTMDYPVKIWGKEYYIPPITKRKNSQIVRIYACQDSTIIYHNFKPIDTLFNTGIQDQGWCEIRLNGMNEPVPAVISSNNPIYVNFFYPSWTEDSTTFSDPFTLSIVPQSFFSKDVMFTTPHQTTSNTFDSNYINIVYKSSTNDSILLSYFTFQFIDEEQQLETINLDDIEIISKGMFPEQDGHFERYFYITLKLPKLGQYYITGQKLFSCYLFGCSDFAAYGVQTFPIDIFLKRDDIEAPGMFAEFSCEGTVVNGYIKDLPEDENIRSNLNNIVFMENESKNVDFSYFPFTSGISSETLWNLNVIDIKNDANAVIKLSDMAGNEETYNFKYYGLNGLQLQPVRNSICLDYYGTDSLIYNLYNPKDTIFRIKLNVNSNNLKIKSSTNIELKPKSFEQIVLEVKYNSDETDAFLVVEKCSRQDTIWLPIDYHLIHYPVNVVILPTKDIYSVGDTVYCDVVLNTDADIEELDKIKSIDIEFELCNVFAHINKSDFINISDKNLVIENIDFYNDMEKLSTKCFVTLTSNNGIFTKVKDNKLSLCYLKFLLALPNMTYNSYGDNFSIKDEYYMLKINSSIMSDFFPCISFYNIDNEIKIEQICADNLMNINILDNPLELNIISNKTISYSISSESYIEVKIYDSMGSLIAIPLTETQKTGLYNIDISSFNLSSGVYFCEVILNNSLRKFKSFIKL